MEILQIIDNLEVGGAERVMVDLSNLLHDKGEHVHVLCISKSGPLEKILNDSIKTTILQRTGKMDITAFQSVVKLLNDCDVAHVHMRHTYRYIAVIAKLSGNFPKLIFHDHYGKIDFDKSIPFGMKTFLKPLTYIGVSKSLVDWASNYLDISKKNIYLRPNTIFPDPIIRNIERSGFVQVGNIKKVKNQLFSLKLIHQLNEKITFYGKVVEPEYFEALQHYVAKHDLENQVSFIHDEVNIQQILPNYSFALQTALSESGPLVLIEYMSKGIPFLSYNTGEVVELLKKVDHQFVIDNFNQEDWEERIAFLREKNNSLRLKEIFNTYFSADKYYTDCLNIYSTR